MAGRLTDRAGSSAYVLGGVVVYSNEAKTALAGVPAALIERHGAVSARGRRRPRGRRDRALRGRVRDRHHRDRRPRRRQRGEARRHGLRQRRGGGRRAARPDRAAARRPGDGPRADDDGRAAPAPAAPRPAVSLRLFVALDLPEAARAALAAFRDEAADPAVWRPVPRREPARDPRLPRAPSGRARRRRRRRCWTGWRTARRRPCRWTARCSCRRAARACCPSRWRTPAARWGGCRPSVSEALAGAGLYEPEARRSART